MELPRRTLTRNFKENLGHSINDEIQRKRLELCCDLLRETDMSIEAICDETGYKSKNYLHRIFREKMNMTPKAYRDANA